MKITIQGVATLQYLFGVTNALQYELFLDLPRKHGRIVPLELGDGLDHGWCCHLGLGASNNAGLDRARLVIATKYLADTAVADAQLP